MLPRTLLKAIATITILLSLHGTAFAQNAPKAAVQTLPFVSPIFGDNMVLQRGKENLIWGWSNPGDKVQVEIGDKQTSGIAATDGHWHLKIQPPPAGGPYELTIKGPQTVELHNVLVGDVWLCGGQSKMQMTLSAVRNGLEEIKAANYPEIRFFNVAAHPAYHRTFIPEGSWKVVSTETADREEKLPVGERLALCALAKQYGKKVVYSGPTLASIERLRFANADGGLAVKGEKLEEFAIAGEDRKWYWADAHIDGGTVVVSSPWVPDPKEVRYAWQSNPTATLYNRDGLASGSIPDRHVARYN